MIPRSPPLSPFKNKFQDHKVSDSARIFSLECV